jgi:uncharacterized DUF497 family protein
MEVDYTGEFEWDPAKAVANQAKHGVSFGQARGVFSDPQHLEEESTQPGLAETRYKTIGRLGPVLVTVIFTYRGKRRRMISARRASRNERERYRRRAESS